jgi:hypothetical protein
MGSNLTIADLLAELTRIQGAFAWRLTRKGRIRGSLKKEDDRRVFDPVTAVAFFRTGEFFPEGHWTEAAASIGLEYSGCAEVIAACNYEWDASCPQGVLRSRLLDSLMPEMEFKKTDRESSSVTNVFLRSSRRRSPNTH